MSYIGRYGLSKQEARQFAVEMNNHIGKHGYVEALPHPITDATKNQDLWYLVLIFKCYDTVDQQTVNAVHNLISQYYDLFQEPYVAKISVYDHHLARKIGFDIPQYRGPNDYRPGQRY